MSEMAAVLGVAHEFSFKGKTYKVAPRDFEIEAYYETWLEGCALEAVQRHIKRMSPVEHGVQLEGWRRDCAIHAYSFGSWECLRSLHTVPGQKQMALLQLQKGNQDGGPRVDMGLVEQIFEDEVALTKLRETQARADADPNRPRPWTTTR